MGVRILIFSSPPSLPQKHVYNLLMGLFERFNFLKRFAVAEIGEIEDNAVERVALPTRAWPNLCPKAKWSLLWDASQDWMTSLAFYVLLVKNKRVVLLTSKPDVRLEARIWRSPPQDVMQSNSSSRLDSRGSFCFQVFNDVVCSLVYLSYSTLTTGFICSLCHDESLFACRRGSTIMIILPDAIRHVIRVCGGCGVLGLNGPEVDCLLCQWGSFVPYWGPRGALIQYLSCKKINAPKVEKYSYSEYYFLCSDIIILSKL